jgi:DNA polymerase III subunit beta
LKLRVATEPFAQAVGWAAKHLPARPAVPVLLGLRLDADDGRLMVEAFDYEVTVRARVPADVQQAGTVLVPGRMLALISERLRGEHLQVALDDGTLTVEADTASFRLQALPLADYPAVPLLPEPIGTVPGSALTAAVTRVAVAAGRDSTVPMLTGVRIRLDSDNPLDLAATDRYRAATAQVTWQPTLPSGPADPASTTATRRRTTKKTSAHKPTASPETTADTTSDDSRPTSMLVPVQIAIDIAKTLAAPSGDTPITLALAHDTGRPTMLGVKVPREGNNPAADRELITRLLDNDFVDVDRLTPATFTGWARLHTATILDAVRRVGTVAERHTPVSLDFTTTGQVHLQAGHGDEVQGTDTVSCDFNGKPLTIAFNPGYLSDALTTIHTPTVQFAFTSPETPALLTPHTSDADQTGPPPTYRHLLMPIRLSR